MNAQTNSDFDVVVLGSGLAGSILATILARHGHRVAMLERGTHPRMAIGESLVPASALWFWVLGEKHDIPEIRTLAHLDSISRNVAPTSGVKRGFSYIYHRPGQERIVPEETSFFIGPTQPIYRESQLFREDIDHYLVKQSVGYGVEYRDNTAVTDVDITPDGARVSVADGSVLRARYVVDATGRNSVLARSYALRDSPTRLRHHSRTIFSHFTDVQRLEDLYPGGEGRKVSASFSKGTHHHVFDGGWMWVIPFNNYALSKNDLVSIGITVDPRVHPRPEGVSAQDEFWGFVDRYPIVKRHLGPARAVRPYVGTDRIQYSSKTTVGDRFVLLQHAAGFVDPLFSRGIWRSQESIDVVADELLEALADGDFSAERFAGVDRAQQAMLDDTDQLVFNAFRAMSSYDTWTSWLRVWFAEEFMTTIPILAATARCVLHGDKSAFTRLKGERRPGTSYAFYADLQRQIDDAERDLDAVENGELSPTRARELISGRLADADYLPHPLVNFRDPWRFGMDLTPPEMMRMLWWGRRAPEGVRRAMFDFDVAKLLKLLALDALPVNALRRDRYGNVITQ